MSVAILAAVFTALLTAGATPTPTATVVGAGGGVATVDADATAAGPQVLERGGTAAVAAAAALGVTEPYSAGIGGGGFLVHYDA